MPDVIKEDDKAYYTDTGMTVFKQTLNPENKNLYANRLADYQTRMGNVPASTTPVAPGPMSPVNLPTQSVMAPVPAPIPLTPVAPPEGQEGFVPAAVPTAPQAPVVPQTVSVSTEAPSSSVTKKSMDKETKTSLDQATKGLIDAETKQQEASAAAVQAQTDMAMAKAKKEEELAAVTIENEKTRQARLAEKNQHFETSVAQQAAMKVDPGKFWAERTTEAKIGIGIAMAMGAVGQALSRGNKNYALDVIDTAIDRDIAAQRANIAAKGDAVRAEENSLQAFRVRLGDERLAELAAKDVALRKVENSFIERMGATKSDAAIAAGQGAIAQIRQKRAEIMVQANAINATETTGGTRTAITTEIGKTPGKEAAPTEFQGKAAMFAAGAKMAEANFKDIESKGYVRGKWSEAAMKLLPEGVRSELQKRQNQAEMAFADAFLRQTSGAAISDTERKDAATRFFPRAGDSPAVVQQKERDRQLQIDLMKQLSGPAGKPQSPTFTPASYAGSGK